MTWPLARLGDVAAVIRGVTYKKTEERDSAQDGYLPLLRATNIGASLNTSSDLVYVPEERVAPRQRLETGDIILASSSGSLSVVGKSAILRTSWQGTFGAFCAAIRARGVDPHFLALFLSTQGIRQSWSDSAKGTNINNLKLSSVENTLIPLPPPREQRRIVEILEEHLSRLDAAEAELARARPRSDALLLTALRAHVEELRSVGAPFARIGDVAETNLGKMLDAKKAHGEPTPYLANINVRWGRFDLENLKVVPLTTEERNRLTMQPGDVIVCEGGEPGRCAVWDLDNSGIAYQKALHRVRVHDTGLLEPKYLALMLRESIQSGRVNRLFTGTTIKHLPQEKLRLIEVPVPEHSVQEVALEELAAVALSGERLAAALQIAKLRSDSLRRAVLAAAFEGKLTGRHTDAEVIEELAQG